MIFPDKMQAFDNRYFPKYIRNWMNKPKNRRNKVLFINAMK
jgi:hypothetical protein